MVKNKQEERRDVKIILEDANDPDGKEVKDKVKDLIKDQGWKVQGLAKTKTGAILTDPDEPEEVEAEQLAGEAAVADGPPQVSGRVSGGASATDDSGNGADGPGVFQDCLYRVPPHRDEARKTGQGVFRKFLTLPPLLQRRPLR
ncbi:unnamed protein product [Bemisia tabaci]|uniref:Uncharacterized protein n=1 Tax=Bemisia tabaci TaxID=7038 RepID=A0A9P0A7D0_BEMTA|nr:unnamed protein product [Bemisia tabaci]